MKHFYKLRKIIDSNNQETFTTQIINTNFSQNIEICNQK